MSGTPGYSCKVTLNGVELRPLTEIRYPSRSELSAERDATALAMVGLGAGWLPSMWHLRSDSNRRDLMREWWRWGRVHAHAPGFWKRMQGRTIQRHGGRRTGEAARQRRVLLAFTREVCRAVLQPDGER